MVRMGGRTTLAATLCLTLAWLGLFIPVLNAQADATPTVVLDYGATDWAYQEVASGAGAGFEATSFDDSNWPRGQAGFGTKDGTCSWNNATQVKTQWDPNTDILLRHQFTLPAGATGVQVLGTVDNYASIFVNGTQLGPTVADGNCTSGGIKFDVPQSLLGATNVIAIRGNDYGNATFLDVQVTATASVPSPNPTPQPDFKLTVTPTSGTAVTTFKARYRVINCADGSPTTETIVDKNGKQVDPYDVATERLSGTQNPQFKSQDFKVGQLGLLSPELLCNGAVVAKANITISANTYVALGDSYSAGEGASLSDFDPTTKANIGPGGTSSGCHRATTGYANEIARYYEGTNKPTWTFAACSGAEIRNLYQLNTSYSPFEVEVPQLAAVDPATTKLVTMTIGGNDVGFVDIFTECVYGAEVPQLAPGHADCTNPDSQLKDFIDSDDQCKCDIPVNLYDYVQSNLAKLTEGGVCVPSDADGNCVTGVPSIVEGHRTLSQSYVDIANRVGPGGRVVVGGYPEFFGSDTKYYKKGQQFGPSGYACQVGTVGGLGKLDVDYKDAQQISKWSVLGNQAIQSEVNKANQALKSAGSSVQVVYADGVDKAFNFHRLCDSQPAWINGAQIDTGALQPRQTSFHPKTQGQHAYALAFEAAIPKLK